MRWESFKDKFHESWHSIVRPFIESPQCDAIYGVLKKRTKEGALIAPSSSQTFRTFLEVPIDKIQCILIGYCPYHTFEDEYKPVADGLAFSCSNTNKQQPSLRIILEGWEEELYGGLLLNSIQNTADLSYLSRMGVLLLNSSLTVEKDKPGSHQELWTPFTKYILEEGISKMCKNIPIVLVGKEAQMYELCISNNVVYKVEHPSFAARQGRKWNTEGVFKEIQDKRKEEGKEEIGWLDEIPPF